MNEGGQLRVSDEQREQAVREIREHYAAGRLTDEELSQRVQAAYSAATEAELAAARADLPLLPATAEQQRAELVARRSQLQRRVLQQTGAGLVPFFICTVIWAASGASGMFWPVWILLIALIPLLRHGWDLYGPDPQLDRVEAELARREEKNALERSGRHEQRQLERGARRRDRRDRRR